MHNFDHLVYRGIRFTLDSLNETHSKVIQELEIRGSTNSVKNLQMIRLQKAILALGMFSLFESTLQTGLKCENGFKEAKQLLVATGQGDLIDRFQLFIAAINVLKHGRGRAYDFLVEKFESLPFRIKLPRENFFFEGDVSEISTLIEVDDMFVLNCAQLIEDVSNVIRRKYSDY